MEQLNDYEVSYLVNPKTEEEARQKLDSAVDEKVSELAGTIAHSSPSLRRRLAYEVQENPSAFLRTIQIQLDPSKVEEFDLFLKKAEGVLRFSLLKTAKRAEVRVESVEPEKAEQAEKKAEKPAKEVSMKDVEKGIEDALSEEVK